MTQKKKTIQELQNQIRHYEEEIEKCREEILNVCFDETTQWIKKQKKSHKQILSEFHKHIKGIDTIDCELNTSAWYQGYCRLDEHLELELLISDIMIDFEWNFLGNTDNPDDASKALRITFNIPSHHIPKIQKELLEFSELDDSSWSVHQDQEKEDQENEAQEIIHILFETYDHGNGEPEKSHLKGCELICAILFKLVDVDVKNLPYNKSWDYLCQLFTAPLISIPCGDQSMFQDVYVKLFLSNFN